MPFREVGVNGTVLSQTRSYIEFGREDSHNLVIHYLGIGRLVVTFARYIPEYTPSWAIGRDTATRHDVPPPPAEAPVRKGPPALVVLKD